MNHVTTVCVSELATCCDRLTENQQLSSAEVLASGAQHFGFLTYSCSRFSQVQMNQPATKRQEDTTATRRWAMPEMWSSWPNIEG